MAKSKKNKKADKKESLVDLEKIEAGVRLILEGIGENPDRPGLQGTPRRVAKMYDEICAGLHTDARTFLHVIPAETHEEMVIVKGIPIYSLCVPSKQLINAVDGAKQAATVQVGDKLWTLNDGRVVETEVISIASRKTRELVEVTTSEGKYFVTPEHPFATPDGWVEAADLEGKEIEWTFPRSLCRNRYEPQMGYSLGYAIGAMFSDGTTSARYISLVVNEFDFAARFAKALREAFDIEANIESVERPSGFTHQQVKGFRVRVVSSYLADLFRMWAGGDAHHMRQKFPRVVLNSFECTQGFIDGYVDGDGFRMKNNRGSMIISGNVDFLTEMAQVIDASFTPNRKTASHLYVSDRWNQAGWYGKHGFIQESHRTSLIESKYVKVLSVKKVIADGRKPFTVFSFTCDPYPTFLISGHLSHNCEHHLLPFKGVAHIAYIPKDGRIVGLSKLARIADMMARKPQIQERLTTEIADLLFDELRATGVMVVIEAEHMCMEMRGIKKPGSKTITSALRGGFLKDPRTRAEAMALIRNGD